MVYDSDIEWLLTASEALAISASPMEPLSTGGYDAGVAEAHVTDAWLGSVSRARRLRRVWRRLGPDTQEILVARYTCRERLPAGIRDALGDLVGVALLLATRTGRLGTVVGDRSRNARVSRAASDELLDAARRACESAHTEWRSAAREEARRWAAE